MNNTSSFSSISFDSETAIKFKKLAREQNKTHTQFMSDLLAFAKAFPANGGTVDEK